LPGPLRPDTLERIQREVERRSNHADIDADVIADCRRKCRALFSRARRGSRGPVE
jgi:hypothetical protein